MREAISDDIMEGCVYDPRKEQMQLTDYPDKFWLWLKDNEHVYQKFIETSFKAKQHGINKWSAMAIVQIMRWQTATKEQGALAHFKINNNYSPGLARLAMAEHAMLRGFFELRRQYD